MATVSYVAFCYVTLLHFKFRSRCGFNESGFWLTNECTFVFNVLGKAVDLDWICHWEALPQPDRVHDQGRSHVGVQHSSLMLNKVPQWTMKQNKHRDMLHVYSDFVAYVAVFCILSLCVILFNSSLQQLPLNWPCLFLISGQKPVQKAFHSQQRRDPHSSANGRRLTQIQNHGGQREVGPWEQRDCLVNQILPCEHKSSLTIVIFFFYLLLSCLIWREEGPH